MDKELEKLILDCLAKKRREIDDEDFWWEFRELPEDQLSMCHFGLGLHLRNYVLQPSSAIYKMFISERITHKDDMSSAMIELWHRELNKE